MVRLVAVLLCLPRQAPSTIRQYTRGYLTVEEFNLLIELRLTGFQQGSFPFRHLGIPLTSVKLKED